MPPGRKVQGKSTKPKELPLTDYEKERAQNMTRNNQVLQRLGVSALASKVNCGFAKSNGEARQESRSLFQVQENEDSEEEEVNQPNKTSQVAQGVHENSSETRMNTSSRGARASKRVLAPEQQDEPTSVTRQKARDLALAMSPQLQQVQTGGLTTATPTPQSEQQVDMSAEGALEASIDPDGKRNRSMGRELDRISRGLCTKIPIHVTEGKRRPEAPMKAAKLASEGGIIVRQHMPILTHWKEYKKDESHINNYIGKAAAQFTMDTNSNAIKYACADLLKGGQRQRRYRLKKKYFNGIPANQVRTTAPVKHMTDDQWKALVEMWSNSNHKETCKKNQLNRENVRLHQRTGSRCYIAQAHVVKQDKYKDVEPTAIDLFKDFHCSKNSGYSKPVKKAIADMEAIMTEPAQDGQEPKLANEAISQVVQSTTFLRVAGVRSASKNNTRGGTSLQVQELQAELEIEKQEKTELQQQIDVQRQELDTLKMQAEASRVKHFEEIESLKKKSEDTRSCANS